MMKFRLNQDDTAIFTTSAIILKAVQPENITTEDPTEIGIVLNSSVNPIIETAGEHNNLILYISASKKDVSLMHFTTNSDGDMTAKNIEIDTMTQAEVDDFLDFEADFTNYMDRLNQAR